MSQEADVSMRCIWFFAVVTIVATGCQSGPRVSRHIELLNAEKRALEDELYDMEFEYKGALKKVDELRRENAELEQRLGISPGSRSRSWDADQSRPDKKPGSPGLDLSPPMIDEGMLTEPKVELPDQKPAPKRELPLPQAKPPATPPSPMTSAPAAPSNATPSMPSWSLEPADPRVTHIHLNPLLTGGSDFDRQPGDDGLVVVIEPRNSENVFVALAGPISVVLLDPTKQGESARVARWDLLARDTQQAIQNSTAVKGIQLRLPWPQHAPANNRLQLFVRYVTVDGRKLEANREIFVTLPGQVSQRWMPRSSGRAPTSQPGIAQAGKELEKQAGELANGSDLESAKPDQTHLARPLASKSPPPPSAGSAEPATETETTDPDREENKSNSETARTALPEWRPYR